MMVVIKEVTVIVPDIDIHDGTARRWSSLGRFGFLFLLFA
jgi:hypothetical protein